MIKLSLEQETAQKYAMKEIMSQAKNGNALPEGDYILIMPFASSWQDKEGKWHENAKNYPYWNELIKAIKLTYPKLKVIQTGLGMEPALDGIDEKRGDLTLKQLKELTLGAKTFICSDTYLQHLGAYYEKRGIVLWGQNNPKHFGHKLHENIYVNSQYFRKETWSIWQGVPRNNESFARPGVVLAALKEELKDKPITIEPIISKAEVKVTYPEPVINYKPGIMEEAAREEEQLNEEMKGSTPYPYEPFDAVKNAIAKTNDETDTLFKELQLEVH